jgi:hypothetical protein
MIGSGFPAPRIYQPVKRPTSGRSLSCHQLRRAGRFKKMIRFRQPRPFYRWRSARGQP